MQLSFLASMLLLFQVSDCTICYMQELCPRLEIRRLPSPSSEGGGEGASGAGGGAAGALEGEREAGGERGGAAAGPPLFLPASGPDPDTLREPLKAGYVFTYRPTHGIGHYLRSTDQGGPPLFIPADEFVGPKPGYIFTCRDSHGKGYYQDGVISDWKFWECTECQGIPGYVFKKGEHGLGSYADRRHQSNSDEHEPAQLRAEDSTEFEESDYTPPSWRVPLKLWYTLDYKAASGLTGRGMCALPVC